MLCFGGGVLLSTVLIHMLAEVRVSMERAAYLGIISEEVEFPFAELFICLGNSYDFFHKQIFLFFAGFVLILFIESTVHKLCGEEEHGADDDHHNLPVHAHKEVGMEVRRATKYSILILLTGRILV